MISSLHIRVSIYNYIRINVRTLVEFAFGGSRKLVLQPSQVARRGSPLATDKMKRFAATLLLAAVAAADESVVQTALGPVQGIVQDRFRVFEGVPYAAPPVGELRWQPPQPVAAWGPSVLNATVDPPGCVQLCTEDEPPHICPGSHISEDCLYMNIWTPRMPNGPPAQPLPVVSALRFAISFDLVQRFETVCAHAGVLLASPASALAALASVTRRSSSFTAVTSTTGTLAVWMLMVACCMTARTSSMCEFR